MKAMLLALVLAMALIPAYPSFSQLIDTDSKISVITTSDSPYVYKNSEGHTVVVGEVENRNALSSMSGIVVRAVFYDPSGEEVIEIVRGGTVLDIVPPESTSPYLITSASANPDIGLVSVDVEAFNSSPTKSMGLEISPVDISNSGTVEFAGSVKNAGHAPSGGTVVHLAFYDVFDPPRLLHIEQIPVGHVPAGAEAGFQFSGTPDSRAVGFTMFAESDVLQSGFVDVEIPPREILSRLVTISGLSVSGPGGSSSTIPAGSTISIGSDLVFQTVADDRIQPFVYYVQIKQSGKIPYVEFLGSADGSFHGTPNETASVEWTPGEPGLYFIETFAWDQNAVPIASKGPVSVVLVG